ncbi:uncharacterized protein C5orf42 homolog isoform X1 [Sinocyclocheilus rhinocerous]|uniref:Uncharacterized protein n=1 Tax=Sinocyclocheilus rhinocerous TaxID=307959 RepID=A0A673L7T8_9TELE|nr:PREDICTED: uncharacterized protein C5orf42 homolog isoform X1 [Sinocyclocheilus rhinocerous]
MMEEERRDLRMWMRRKQRERLIEYRKQREEKRERERRPFISPVKHQNPTSVDLAASRRTKEERARLLLQEHHEQRARDACGLISELLTTPINLPTNPQQSLRITGKNKRIPRSQSGPQASLGKTVVLQRKSAAKTHGSLSGRLGLHRPASALPADRLSRVTRRGMLSDPKSRQDTKTVHHLKQRAVKEKDQTHERDDEEDQDIRPGCETLDEELTDADLLRDLDLDALSQSTGSVLSKLDWAAIERIVAEQQ